MRKLRREMPRRSNGKSRRRKSESSSNKSEMVGSNKSVGLFIKALVRKKGGKVVPKWKG